MGRVVMAHKPEPQINVANIRPYKPFDFGLLGVVKSYGLNLFRSRDLLGAVLIGGVGSYFYVRYVPGVGSHTGVAGYLLSIAASLFGVIIAGFAIVAALVDMSYARGLQRYGSRPYDVLRHFLFEGAVLIASLTGTITYEAIAQAVNRTSATAQDVLFGVVVFLFFWGLFGAFDLMRLILSIAVSRAAAGSEEER
jgi:hypothetical protein